MNSTLLLFIGFLIITACSDTSRDNSASNISYDAPFVWEGANVYFLLTDRFNNGKPENDLNFRRDQKTAKLRGFMGGDIAGITMKIEDGYFDKLGINAIWLSPVVEQIHGLVNEGTGDTYGYHGYWAKDWTAFEPNFGTEEDFQSFVETAHKHGIRVILDVVLNHTGPVTEIDLQWPDSWVRTSPTCTYQGYESTISCTLVENLPDIKTESNENVNLPDQLKEKWAKEGRLELELEELQEFFDRTSYPEAPRYYIIKWLTDMIRKFGVDGFRIDTAKHTEESVWSDLYKEAQLAFQDWKEQNPEKVLDEKEFYMVGEVYGYNISAIDGYNFGDSIVNFFDYGFKSLINFEFKYDAHNSYEEIFSKYSSLLNNELKGKSVLNYISSHDDSAPFDKLRKNPFEAGTKLLLCPGASQVYYGDESARSLNAGGTKGDAELRSFMNWEELDENIRKNSYNIQDVLIHWQKLGTFRRNHPAVGAGQHKMISREPYYFQRIYNSGNYEDVVLVGLDLKPGLKEIDVKDIFEDGMQVLDYYSGKICQVKKGKISLNSDYNLFLLGKWEAP